MKVFQAHITNSVIDFFENIDVLSLDILNSKLKKICGVNAFFETQSEIDELIKTIIYNRNILNEPDRTEFGDFQTNERLTKEICNLIASYNISPEIIIEPTCGKGNFIISCIKTFNNIRKIYAIEIYKPYVWETKFAILDYFLNSNVGNIPDINIYHKNIFDFSFDFIKNQNSSKNFLIIGNPPWVTNSKLSTLDSNNLPEKSNFKKHKGFDAITGKGNFDIGEYISLKLINAFKNMNGHFAFLVKNTVVKNILLEQKKVNYPISGLQQYKIDTKKEFNVSVNACLFLCSLNNTPQYKIDEYDFYSLKQIRKYGWVNNKFVADVNLYQSANFDGKSPFVWRQGLKHDASKIMELEKTNDYFVNNKKEIVTIENDLIFPLVKSSDLKGNVIDTTRKFTIVTQRKVGGQTEYIKEKYPKTYEYLLKNIEYFQKRKSSIYKGKPRFSIFGIGDYSFKPYKVAISGMYKTSKFSLILQNNNKPIMLDDTCYFVGFDKLAEAEITRALLNSEITQNFIKSIAFKDAKRMITKDLLMRIDLVEISKNISFIELNKQAPNININEWEKYRNQLIINKFESKKQLEIFSI